MALQYEYKDKFLADKVTTETLEELENFYSQMADTLEITDELAREEWVTSNVYCEIARRNIEGSGFDKKLEVYQQKVKEAYQLAKTKRPSLVSNLRTVRS